jgi:hypothetical protein
MKKILSNGYSNAKTAKNVRESVILYLAPFTQNSKGINLCPKASKGCIEGCLFTSGLASVYATINNARIARTEHFLSNRKEFLQQIIKEMNAAAKKANGDLAVRLNGTSDVKLVEMAIATGIPIASNIVFYDYTKILKKAGERTLASGHRYMVTFSRSETNESEMVEHLRTGGIAAVVFNSLPTTYMGFPVVDGDERDDLMLDVAKGTILGLKAKGKAKDDMSGFVVTESVARMTMEERAEFEQFKLEIKAIAKGDFSSELKAISE